MEPEYQGSGGKGSSLTQAPSGSDGSAGSPGDQKPRIGGGSGGGKWILIIIVLIIAALIGGGKIAREFSHSGTPTPAQQQTQTVPLVIGEKEYEEFGLPKTASYADIWREARKRPVRGLQLCPGETILVTHGMGQGEVATVNGITVTAPLSGFGLIRIPAGATQVEITGVNGGQDGKIVFILDAFSNQSLSGAGMQSNSCDLAESHNGVAVATGETVIIPITYRF